MSGSVGVTLVIVLGLAFLLIVPAAVAVFLVRVLPGKPPPDDILQERYARGEIDAQQFEDMRRRLSGGEKAVPRVA